MIIIGSIKEIKSLNFVEEIFLNLHRSILRIHFTYTQSQIVYVTFSKIYSDIYNQKYELYYQKVYWVDFLPLFWWKRGFINSRIIKCCPFEVIDRLLGLHKFRITHVRIAGPWIIIIFLQLLLDLIDKRHQRKSRFLHCKITFWFFFSVQIYFKIFIRILIQ